MKYLWSVATGNIDIFKRASRKAVKYIMALEGFVAVHPTPNHEGTLWMFDSENNAKGARNMMRSKGIQCGTNICRFKWDGGSEMIFDDENFKSEERDK